MKYARGDTVYLIDGSECEYVITFGHDQHLVNRIFTSGEELFVDPLVVHEIFPEPPVAKRAKAIADLDREISEKEREISRLQQVQRGIEMQSKHFNDLIKRNEALQFVDAFLERRFNHLVSVEESGTIRLQDFHEALKADKQYDSGLKLLSLFGKSSGDLQWRLHQYSTEERHPVEVHPFFELSAALIYIQSRIDQLTAEYIVDNDNYRLGNIRASIGAINLTYETDLKLPEYVAEQLRKSELQKLAYRKEKLLEELRALEKELKE